MAKMREWFKYLVQKVKVIYIQVKYIKIHHCEHFLILFKMLINVKRKLQRLFALNRILSQIFLSDFEM